MVPGHAAEEVRALLHPVEELGGARAGDAAARNVAHLDPGRVQRFPHLGSDQPAHRVSVLARPFEAAVDRGGILLVERHELDQRGKAELVVALFVQLLGAGNRERREQILVLHVLGAEQHQVGGDAEDACRVFGTLHLPAHPVNAVRDPREHGRNSGTNRVFLPIPSGVASPLVKEATRRKRGLSLFLQSTTHVSFVPPPCDEFTTSEPSFSATRVRPPGTSFASLPEST